jgi:hypothetical protein
METESSLRNVVFLDKDGTMDNAQKHNMCTATDLCEEQFQNHTEENMLKSNISTVSLKTSDSEWMGGYLC